MKSGELIRTARVRHGLTQQRLALRTGIHQSAIRRFERDEISPSLKTLELVLNAMGERLELASAPLERHYDPGLRRAFTSLPVEERLRLAISWNRAAGRIRATEQASATRERAPED